MSAQGWFFNSDLIISLIALVFREDANGMALTYWELYVLGLLKNKLVNYGALKRCTE